MYSKIYFNLWSCQKALTFLLDNIYIRFGSKLYRQIVGMPVGYNCTPLVADLFLYCYERNAFFTSDKVKNYNIWYCQKVCEALTFLLDNIYIRFGFKYRKIVGIPMDTNFAPFVADVFLYCYGRDFMLSLSDVNQSEVIETFISTSSDWLVIAPKPNKELFKGSMRYSGCLFRILYQTISKKLIQ